jgi:hypothetical protein
MLTLSPSPAAFIRIRASGPLTAAPKPPPVRSTRIPSSYGRHSSPAAWRASGH